MRPRTILATLALAGLSAIPLPLSAQAGDTTRADTARVDSGPPTPPPLPTPVLSAPLPPTPGQAQYLDGLRTAGRGIAQLKNGVDRVQRTQAGRDTVGQRRAARRLGGLCTAARDFMSRGRARMRDTVYTDTTQIKARRLGQQIDALIKFTPTCEANAGRAPEPTVKDLLARIRNYETALNEFRVAIGLPIREEKR